MNRAVLVLIPAAALMAFAAAQHAEARSKAYCRDWAQGFADRNAGAADPAQQAASGDPSMPVLGAATDGQATGDGVMTAGATSSPAPGSQPPNGRWEDLYQRAYAECRAS